MFDSVHFRCTFDVSPAGNSTLGFVELVGDIAQWIKTKEGRALDLQPSWMLTAGTSRRPDGRALVITDSLPAQSSMTSADTWALRYEHQDSEFSHRRWSIDFGVVRLGEHEWRLATTVGHSLHPSYMGKEPGHLPVTPPRVVKDLVGAGRWKCSAGSIELKSSPVVVAVGKADRLVKAIEDPLRACALVYVSRARASGEPCVDPARLASTITGAGIVFVAADSEIDDELEFLMVPREFRAPNGTVRVYAPGADFGRPNQSFRHRFFTKYQIDESTAIEVEGQIARSLTRRQGWVHVHSSVTSVDEIGTRRRELRRAALQSQPNQESKDELLKLFEDDNERLSKELSEMGKAKEAAEQAADERDMQLEGLREEIRTASYGADFFRSESADAKRKLTLALQAGETARSIRQLPSNVAEVVSLIERLHGGSVTFTDEARQSAAEATLDDPNIAWECLYATATVLPRLAFEVDGADLSQTFQDETGFVLSLTEGKLTKKDKKFADLRKVTLDGREWDICAHIKHGTKPPKCLRVYFALDREGKRIIIGHCGDHLDTAGTQRRK